METPAAQIAIKDRDEAISVSIMRGLFEQIIKETDKLKDQPIQAHNTGQFFYENDETNILWNGFALGMRCAERILKVEMSNLI